MGSHVMLYPPPTAHGDLQQYGSYWRALKGAESTRGDCGAESTRVTVVLRAHRLYSIWTAQRPQMAESPIALTTTRVASSASRTLMKTLVQSSLWRKGMVRRRAQSIVHSLLRARLTASRFVAPSASCTEEQRLLEELFYCSKHHLSNRESFSIAHGYGAESFILRFCFVFSWAKGLAGFVVLFMCVVKT